MVVKEDLRLPFTFIRVLTMSVTVKRIVSTCDFPEISEQLAVTGPLTRTHARTHARTQARKFWAISCHRSADCPLLMNPCVDRGCGEGGGREC